MRRQKVLLGYDLNEKNCQISCYNERKEEPETMEVSADHYQIPLVLGFSKGNWYYGTDARKRAQLGECELIDGLYEKAVSHRKVQVGKKLYDGVRLLAKFMELTLKPYPMIEYLTFTTPEVTVDVAKMMRSIGRHLGLSDKQISVQDYKESFCHYMFYQPKELWQYESALFYCDANIIRACTLRKLNANSGRGGDLFVTVEEVARAKIGEWEAIYPFLVEEQARTADENFKAFIQNVFEKKVVSSVYLTGEGFENNWYPDSLKVLCNGRRAFAGNNLYSKGACYSAMRKKFGRRGGPIYLDDTKLMQKISVRMRADGEEQWYPLVMWGTGWYEADGRWEVLLEDTSDIELHIDSLTGEDQIVETIALPGVPDRNDDSIRLSMELMFIEESVAKLTLRDIGFGDFYPPSDFVVEKEIRLGGIHGQFNSMS